MKKRYWILTALLLLCGVAMIAYPAFSNWVAVQSQDTTIRFYEREVEKLSEQELAALWAAARDYNSRLPAGSLGDPFAADEAGGQYLSLLNVEEVMGYIDIPSVEISLPIYHGTSDAVLRKGVGHLFGSALPIGGEGTHAVLTSHSGLASAKLFTDLERIAPGDRFYIRVLDDTLAYEVDQILVVEPHEVEAIHPVPGEDYVTLITCTPYAVNSHRLLARGARVAGYEAEDLSELPQSASDRAAARAGEGAGWRTPVPWMAAAVILLGIVCVRRGVRRGRGKGGPP